MIEVDVPALLDRLRVSHKRRGRARIACCPLPLHNADGSPDREPSWSMHDEPGSEKHSLHYCFGCKRGGGPADLAAAVLGIDLREAREWILSGAVLREQDLPVRVIVSVRRGKPPFLLPDGVVLAPIEEWPTPARAYLLERGVTASQAARWGLGYAVDGRLAMRVVVPVRDAAGAICSFVARSFTGAPKRYLEPREEDGADRGAIVGEHLWSPPERRRALMLGEGVFDTWALERATGLPVGALHGSPSPGQAGFDAVAGKLATWPMIGLAVDPNDAGERLYESLRGALGRYSRVVPIRPPQAGAGPKGRDVADLSVEFGDRALASLVHCAGIVVERGSFAPAFP